MVEEVIERERIWEWIGMVKKKMIGVEKKSKGIREKRMNRMECVRMSVEEDNGRERGEEKQ